MQKLITQLINQYYELKMLGQINKTLNKQITHLKLTLSKNQHHSQQELFSYLDQMEKSLQTSYKTILQAADKKATESKNQLKKQNKLLHHYQSISQKKQEQLLNENQNLKDELAKNKKKLKQLIKLSEKYTVPQEIRLTKSSDTKGTQCQLKDVQMEEILQDLKNQNISLNQKIIELEKTIDENQQNIDSANVLIKELIRQLETNISDRETWNDAQSQRSEREIESNRISSQQDSDFNDYISNNSYQMSQSADNCQAQTAGQDTSTLDGSNTTHRDFALPEWLEFDEPTLIEENLKPKKQNEQELKMWPQLLFNRCRQLFGMSFEI